MPEYQHKNQTWKLEPSGSVFTISNPYGSIRLNAFTCDHHAPMAISEGDPSQSREMYAAEGQYVSVGVERHGKKHLSVGVQGMNVDFYDVPEALIDDLFSIPVITTEQTHR
ncbi:MAG: hypothetical protein CVV27_12845 [Candidatus Melainabacteria bacterium HGW-Melainabacteria-1]|nr:MAG: hypothetical protein CVV27_12845 [Candidatus Melainabacteria bacterium HGW-Melainabacteria-1]